MNRDPVSDVVARRWRLLMRGEAMVASVGIALAAVLLAFMGVTAWWVRDGQIRILTEARQRELDALARSLGQSVELMLASGELSAVRRLVVRVAYEHQLTDCRVSLPDGRVLASAQPSAISLTSLPERWSNLPQDASTWPSPLAGQMQTTITLMVPGRGVAYLSLSAPSPSDPMLLNQAQTTLGLAGAAALLALLLIYRHLRQQLTPILLVQQALATLGNESTTERLDPQTLKIAGCRSPEIEAWNRLLRLAEQWRQQAVQQEVRQVLSHRHQKAGVLEQACDALPMGVVLIDSAGAVRYVNGAGLVFLGRPRPEVEGHPFCQLVQDPAVQEAVTACCTGVSSAHSGRRVIESRREDASGQGVLRFGIRPLKRSEGETAIGTLVTIEDITQLHVAQQSRNAFVSQAAHELRTPLTNIRLYLETALEEGQKDPAVLARALNVIGQESRRLELVIEQILSTAQIEAGSLQIRKDDVRLDRLFEELELDYRAQAQEKKVDLRFHLPPKLPVIQADRDKLALALHNVLGNALKYTPEGGRVTVSVTVDTRELTVAVSDTGIGIAPQELDRIFERFYRSSDPRVAGIKGTGLGLTLAREVMRAHGGDITVVSELNKGSTFTLTLPIGSSWS